MKYSFNQWLGLIRFRQHRVVNDIGLTGPFYHQRITLENSKGERVKLPAGEYDYFLNRVCYSNTLKLRNWADAH